MGTDSVRAAEAEAALLASLPEPQGVSALSGDDQPRGTEGPWQIKIDALGYSSIYGTNEDGGPGDLVAHIYADDEHLVSAAPDLRDAAFEARSTIGDLQSALHDVLNLIDYMRYGDGSLPVGGPRKLAEANSRLRGGRTDSLSAAIFKALGQAA